MPIASRRARSWVSSRSPALAIAIAIALASLDVTAIAQCAATWTTGAGVNGVANYPSGSPLVDAIATWDPDGPGPGAPQCAIAGVFNIAGDVTANGVASWDPATDAWMRVGRFTSQRAYSLTTSLNGELIAGGALAQPGDTFASGVGRWTGSQWSMIGANFSSPTVYDLAVLPNGDIIAAGQFNQVGTTTVANIARWNGATWQPLGFGLSREAKRIAVLPNGDIVAAGRFTVQGGFVRYLFRFDGTSWSEFGGNVDNDVTSLAVLANGDLVVSGNFTTIGNSLPIGTIARWDGTTWHALGSGMTGRAERLLPLPTGGVVALGGFSAAGGLAAGGAAVWDGLAWTPMGTGFNTSALNTSAFTGVVLPTGEVIAGGRFTSADTDKVASLARWSGSQWRAVRAGGLPHEAFTTCWYPNGDLLIGNMILPSTNTAGIARWDGTTLHPLATYVAQFTQVSSVRLLPNGDVLAAGFLAPTGGTIGPMVASWNGNSWSQMGGLMSGGQFLGVIVHVLPSGAIIAYGTFTHAGGVPVYNIARWDGSAWQPLGTGVNGAVSVVLELSNGDLVVGGGFTFAEGRQCNHIARWDGAHWWPMGLGFNSSILDRVLGLAEMPNGDVIATGSFGFADSILCNRVARWNGTSWGPMGTGFNAQAGAICVLPDGDVIVAGNFSHAGTVQVNQIARWNGTTWQPATPTTSPADNGFASGTALALKMLPSGRIAAVGNFYVVGDRVGPFLTELASNCPADAPAYGAGCVGPAGPMLLTADTLPWIGSTFRATARAFASNTVALGLVGLTPANSPIANIHPAGVAGCDLLVDPDVSFGFSFPVAGAARIDIAIPANPTLVGLAGYVQVAQIEIDAQATVLSITSSNGLALTIGAF